MKTTIEQLTFPCEIKNKIKIKVIKGNLKVEYIDGHLVRFDKMSVQEPHKIIVSNKNNTLIAFLYETEDKVYLQVSVILNCKIEKH